MKGETISNTRPTVIVGVDFGTTFSGFAYALASEPEKIRKFYDWPGAQGEDRKYCKTQTSLLYVSKNGSADSYVLDDWGYSALAKNAKLLQPRKGPTKRDWGHSALAKHAKLLQPQKGQIKRDWGYSALAAKFSALAAKFLQGQIKRGGEDRREAESESESAQLLTRLTTVTEYDGRASRGTSNSHIFVSKFKLLLAEQDPRTSADNPRPKLPKGLTARKTISDYLRKLSGLVLNVLQKEVGSHISIEDIQWCLTVPALWNEQSKQEMITCAEMGGLVRGPSCSDHKASPHALILVLEPEAASAYCQQALDFPFKNGDKFLVVDCGGGTVDLVLHEKAGHQKVRELSSSSGGLLGGTFVDEKFFMFLSRKIKCFPKFYEEEPLSVLKLRGDWETIKNGFDDNMHSGYYEIELGAKLARAWENDDKSKNSGRTSQDASFDTIDFSREDILSIFDPVVNEILALIRVKMIKDLRAIMLVGGFSGSPYLVKRIKEAFSQQVRDIIVPPEPGCAICCGAVIYGVMGADLVSSRITKKTYGTNTSRTFQGSDPAHLRISGEGGKPLCDKIFHVYVRKGDEVDLDKCVSRVFRPIFNDQTESRVGLYSTLESDPKFVDEPGIKKEGSFIITYPSKNQLGEDPKFTVSLYFGRTTVEVKAVGTNFGEGELFKMPAVNFEKSFN